MKSKSSRGGREGDGGLTLDDFRLWRDFTRDIDSYEDRDWEELEKLISEQSPHTQIIKGPVQTLAGQQKTVSPSKNRLPAPRQEPQLDASTERNIRSGKMPIEGKLDLHGYYQEEANRRLIDFINAGHRDGKRLLLVITGKGKGGANGAWYDIPEGVLKKNVPLWLATPPLREIVLRVYPAHRKHGGDGACYVYLKRQRSLTF